MLNMNNIIIITGVAGFIGYSLADKLLNKRYSIIVFRCNVWVWRKPTLKTT